MNKAQLAYRIKLSGLAALILVVGYLFPLLPPVFLKKALEAISRGQAAWGSVLALLATSILRVIVGFFSTHLLRWISDRESLQLMKKLLQMDITGIPQNEMHNLFTSEIPKYSQRFANDVVFGGQCLALAIIGLVMYNASLAVFLLAYIPAIVATLYLGKLGYRSRVLHDIARSTQEEVKSVILSALRHGWNVQSHFVRSRTLGKVKSGLERRTDTVSNYRKELSRQNTLSMLIFPVGTLVIVLAGIFSPVPLGIPNLALMLAYFGSVSMLSRGIAAAFNERGLIQSAGQKILAVGGACDILTEGEIDLHRESVFHFESTTAFASFIKSPAEISDELHAVGLSSEKLKQLGTNGNGLSNGENKRLYVALALAHATGPLTIHGLKEMLDKNTFLNINQRISEYSRTRNRQVDLK